MTRKLPETPITEDDPTQILTDFFQKQLLDVHTTLPGRIVKYEGHVTRKATVEVSVNLPTNTGEFIVVKPITNVPIVFPSTGSSSILFPIKKGDGVLLLFSEAGIGNFLNGKVTVDVEDFSRYTLTDCIAVPGLFSDPLVPKIEVDLDEESLFIVSNKNQIKMGADGIKIQRESGKLEVQPSGKISLTGASEELIALLSELIQTLSSSTVITGIGPQPFTPDAIANLTALKTRLDTLKV